MTREDERLDPGEAGARKRVPAWFRIPISRRNAERWAQAKRAFEQHDADRTRVAGTIVCVAYALVWLIGWTPSSTWTGGLASIFTINDQPPIPVVLPSLRGGKFVPWGFAGFFIFAAAPFMRTQGRSARLVCALGIFALCGEGVWLVLRGIATLEGTIPLGQAIIWVVVPLGIAAWVLLGPQNEEAEREAAAKQEQRSSPLAGLVIVGAASALLFVLAVWVLFGRPFP